MTPERMAPLISVVVPAFNAAATIDACLDALRAQTWPRTRLEIIVVDDGSTDETADRVAARRDVRLLRQTNAGPSSARNLAVSSCQGTLVAFTDSDCIPVMDWVERLAGHLSDPTVLAIGGNQRCPADATPFMEDVHGVLTGMGFLGGYAKSGGSVAETEHNPSCNVMYRREALVEVGGFRPGMFPGEDVELDYRLRGCHPGARILYDPAAIVFHYRTKTAGGWWRMMRRYGYSSGHNVRLHGFFRLLHAVPWVMAFGLVAWLTLLMLRPVVALAAVCLALAGDVAFAFALCPGPAIGRTLRRAGLILLMLIAFPLGYFAVWSTEPR